MELPEYRGRKATVREIRSKMFVRFFSRSARDSVRLVAMRSGLSAHAFANVGWDRLRCVAQLTAVDQSKLPDGEQLVRFVRDGACDFEYSKLGHSRKLGMFDAKASSIELTPDLFHAFSRPISRFSSRSSSRLSSRSNSRFTSRSNPRLSLRVHYAAVYLSLTSLLHTDVRAARQGWVVRSSATSSLPGGSL